MRERERERESEAHDLHHDLSWATIAIVSPHTTCPMYKTPKEKLAKK